MQHLDLLLQHRYTTLATYLLKHLKHLKHTIATCTFSVASTCCLDEWMLVDAELDANAELFAPVEKCHGGWLQWRRRTHAGEDREAEWGTRWRWPRQVASVDEVGRGREDDAEGGWGLEQEAWMGGDLWRPRFRAA